MVEDSHAGPENIDKRFKRDSVGKRKANRPTKVQIKAFKHNMKRAPKNAPPTPPGSPSSSGLDGISSSPRAGRPLSDWEYARAFANYTSHAWGGAFMSGCFYNSTCMRSATHGATSSARSAPFRRPPLPATAVPLRR